MPVRGIPVPNLTSRTAAEATPIQDVLRPLCVDLDGTLVKSDTLHDSLLALLRTRPALALQLPGRVFQGKAAFKAFVTDSVSLDVAHLPYNQSLLAFLRRENANGRDLYLATGADLRLARRVADHLGIFAGVFGSDGVTNLTGARKLDSLRARLHSADFDYIGNDTPDLPLLSQAVEPMVANPSLRLRIKLRAGTIHPAQTFVDRAPALKSLRNAVRLHQWAKNLLVFVPLFCSHALAPASCSLPWRPSSASRSPLRQPTSSTIFSTSRPTAVTCKSISALLPQAIFHRSPESRSSSFFSLPASPARRCSQEDFLPGCFVYLATTFAYTLALKRYALVDVLALAGLYILRLLAGGAVTATPISHWLAGFSMFLFLSLAFVKRFAELENLRVENAVPRNGRGYLVSDLDQLRSFGTASAYAAVVVFAIYISGVGCGETLPPSESALALRTPDHSLAQPSMAAGHARPTRRGSTSLRADRPHEPGDRRRRPHRRAARHLERTLPSPLGGSRSSDAPNRKAP